MLKNPFKGLVKNPFRTQYRVVKKERDGMFYPEKRSIGTFMVWDSIGFGGYKNLLGAKTAIEEDKPKLNEIVYKE